jgi:putative transposase
MARRLRIQYPGALYHVINRGNYRGDVFATADAAAAFLRALGEAAGMHGWRVHAYAVMRNHFHLALETPEPNLVDGMHLLQSSFATRFNRLRGESGHLFQGRYQALLVEDGAAMATVADYIHLNPVRAGIVPAEHVADFRWSSLGTLVRGPRPPWLDPSRWLAARGLPDDGEGWEACVARLVEIGSDEQRWEAEGLEGLSRGWAIGTEGWRQAVARDYAQLALAPGLAAEEGKAFKEAAWAAALEDALRESGRSADELQSGRLNEPWKLAAAKRVRSRSGAPVVWLAKRLGDCNAATLRTYLSKADKSQS